MQLLTYLNDEFAVQNEIAESTLITYQWSVRALYTWGGPLELHQLSERLLNEWIMHRLRVNKIAPKTAKTQRNDVLRLWQAAADDKLCEPPHREKVRQVTVPQPNPEGMVLSELQRVLDGCRSLLGELSNGVPRCTYFETLMRCGYDTGLRRGDLWKIKRNAVNENGLVVLNQTKTGQLHVCQLSEPAHRMFLLLPGDAPLSWPESLTVYYKCTAKIKKKSGVYVRGLMQPLRRTAASYTELAHRGTMQAFLGHRTPGLAQKHYAVQRILSTGGVPAPPPLE